MEIKQKIIEFLNRNLLLDEKNIYKIRESIHELSEEKLKWVYDVLLDLDNKQTSILQEKLKENPFFFFEMENKAFKEMFKKHLEEEKKERELAEKWLIWELQNY
jgi:hypothetical protein